MTHEEIVNRYTIFKAIRGSKAYGTNIEGSDEDVVGIYIQPDSDITGLNYIPQISLNNGNDVYYELKRFYELAMTGNPNIMEIFNTPEDCIIMTKYPTFWAMKENSEIFLTKNLFNSFANYARSQIKKARGLNKKMNWEQNKVTRKDVLDFCYVITRKEESTPFKKWTWRLPNDERGIEFFILQERVGLAKVNNIPDLYSMYAMENGGIISEGSNDVQLKSIPKDADFLGYLRFDKNAYSTHCKHYREYSDWVKKRNILRYNMNLEHGKGYDAKNMMHCIRLINTAIDIAQKHEIVVRRPQDEIDTLLSIRRGEMEYDDLLKMADEKILIAEKAFSESDLPEDVDRNVVHNLINGVRKLNKNL